MSDPKRHHFVPVSYLNNFIDRKSRFLHVYSKKQKHFRKQKPDQVMVRNKYYHQEWAPEGIDKNILEKKLGREIEPNGLVSLNRLVKDPEKLTDTDTANMLVYLSFQRIRVPRQAEIAKSVADTVLKLHMLNDPIGREALKLGDITIKDSFRIQFMRDVLGLFMPYLSRMVWELIEAESGCSFVTSDSPVSFYNVKCIPPTEPGLGLYGTIVLFPINSKRLLMMSHPEYQKKEKTAMDKLPSNIIFEDGFMELDRGIVWDEVSVRQHNWLMYQLCDDVIVSESKEILEQAINN